MLVLDCQTLHAGRRSDAGLLAEQVPHGLGVAPSACGPRQQTSQPDDVVHGRRAGEAPGDERTAAVAELPQPADRLHPSEALLDELALVL